MPGADRNLLFGVLALQMDFITREALIAAMQAWINDKQQPLGAILCGQGQLTSGRRRMLEELVDEHVQAHRGDAQQSLASVPAASALKQQLQSLGDPALEAGLASLGTPIREVDFDATRQPPTTAYAPADGLRYRVLRPHARGGLGEVFVAEDQELHREVALKEIQARHAHDATSRGRFLLEAEITGGLEHPGIVPVYSLGHYADGRPFYAMRFIRGDNLQEAIKRFHAARTAANAEERREKNMMSANSPSPRSSAYSAVDYSGPPFRQLLRRFLDVCNAVAYAHSRGVLHRDLKPGNIMLGEFGETLVVDWGLAKIVGGLESGKVGAPDERALTLPHSRSHTQMGAAVGTPAFMSPEQAEGKLDQLGPATDVYSLGATLYAVLTGRPPIAEAPVAQVLEKVRRGDIPPCGAGVPPALSAICQKSMALKPAKRYPTPLALAADIEHWLADEPVSAYGEPWPVRTRRWMRKRRTLVTSAAAVLLVALVALTAGMIVVTGFNRQLEDQNRALDQAKTDLEVALNEAKEATDDARALNNFLVNDVLAVARPEGLEGGLGIQVTVREALDAAAPTIAKTFADRPLAEANTRAELGVTYLYLRELPSAIRELERARDLRRQVLGPEHRDTLASMGNLAEAYSAAGRLTDALPLIEETLRLSNAYLGPNDADTLGCMNNLASAYRAVGRLGDALSLHEETLKLLTAELGPEHPKTLIALNELAATYRAAGRLADALPLYEKSLELRRAQFGPDHPRTLTSMNNLALAYRDARRHGDALSLFAETLRLKKLKLGAEHSDTLTSMHNLALAYRTARRFDEALPLFEETLRLRRAKLGNEHPQTLSAIRSLGVFHIDRKDYPAAEALLLEYWASTAKNSANLPPDSGQAIVPALIRLYDKWGKPVEADKWRAELPPADRVRDALERQHAWPLLWGWPRS